MWIVAHVLDMATYVTNIVTLIGIAIAVDYSMLVVFRFREELARQDDPARGAAHDDGHRRPGHGVLRARPSRSAWRCWPSCRCRSSARWGSAGLLVPVVSVLASATLLPALLSLLGRRVNSLRIVPKSVLARRAASDSGFWTRLAHMIMRHPIPVLVGSAAVMLAIAFPALQLKLTGGDNRGIPSGTNATDGLIVLEHTLGPGALAPQPDRGRHRPSWRRAGARRCAPPRCDWSPLLRSDHAIDPSSRGRRRRFSPAPRAHQASLLDPTESDRPDPRRGLQRLGDAARRWHLVHRIRDRYVPDGALPEQRPRGLVTGAPAFGVDFLDQGLRRLPVARAGRARDQLLPAAAGVPLGGAPDQGRVHEPAVGRGDLRRAGAVLPARRADTTLLGLKRSPQIEGWIPIFLFAVLFGLSMDYEVFLLTRMREEWDATHDNEHAVAYGLEHTGRIITAAAIIMIAAFAGFTAGRFVGLQEFGIGLSAAILLDATIVRALLVPGDDEAARPLELVPARGSPQGVPTLAHAPVGARRRSRPITRRSGRETSFNHDGDPKVPVADPKRTHGRVECVLRELYRPPKLVGVPKVAADESKTVLPYFGPPTGA